MYVIGNRSVKSVTIPTDKITQKLFEKYGFRLKMQLMRKKFIDFNIAA